MQEKTLGINDLRRLGRLGNVTGTLTNGTAGELRHDGFYYQKHGAVIQGTAATVKFRIEYVKVLSQLKELKQGSKTIAKRIDNQLVAVTTDFPKAP